MTDGKDELADLIRAASGGEAVPVAPLERRSRARRNWAAAVLGAVALGLVVAPVAAGLLFDPLEWLLVGGAP